MPAPLRVAVAGGGLGGPAAAAALARIGVEATVFEQRRDIVREGSALFVGANAVKALYDLGVGEAFSLSAQYQRQGELRTPTGRVLIRVRPQLMLEMFGHPNACIERTHVRRILLDAAGPNRLRLGVKVEGFEERADGVAVRLSDGSTETFDALVGADGIGSSVREQLLGPSLACYVGYVAWRGVSETEPDWPREVGCEQWGHGRRNGFSYIGCGVWGWWASRLTPQGGRDPESGRAESVALNFAGWSGPIEHIIRSTPDDRILRNDIFVRPPDRAWGRGAVTLLGDAAHLMTPDLGQGACQAIIDGVVLSRVLEGATAADIPARLRTYEALRIPQTTLVARQSFKLGRAAHITSRPGVALRNLLLRSLPSRIQTARVRRIIARSSG